MSRDFSVTLSDFQKRFARLLDKSFRSMDYKLAMSGYVAGMREKSEPRVPDDHTVVKDPEAVDDLKTAANLEALGGEAKHKFHGVKAKHKFRGTRRGGKAQVSWREGETQVSWDLETKGRGRPRGRKWSRGPGRPRGGAADLEALGVKAKHKFHGENAKHKFRGCEEPKQDQVGRGNKR
nr:RNA cytidine acetyltransferase 1-like [Ipomoea batatas]